MPSHLTKPAKALRARWDRSEVNLRRVLGRVGRVCGGCWGPVGPVDDPPSRVVRRVGPQRPLRAARMAIWGGSR